MYEPDNKIKEDKIKEVKDSLYSKNTDAIFVKRRHSLQDNISQTSAPSAWNVEEEKAESSFKIPYTKIFVGAFIFFVIALVFAFSKFFFGANVVSGNNIDILVSGPASIAGGEELPLDIQVKNNNNVDLQTVDLHIEYPDGTKDPIDQTTDLKRFSQVLGDISIGHSQELLAKSIIFGEENTQKTITITVEYRIPGSSAVFSKKKDFNVLLSSSPVNIKVTAPAEINSNQATDFMIDVNSNSVNIVKNLILKVDYPFGFNLVSSNPKSVSSDGSVFNLGDLAPGAKRTIRISGTIAGQNGEQRSFKFTVGNPSADDNTIVSTTYASYLSTISLKKSSIGLDITVNENNSDNIPIDVGAKNTVKISWANNLTEKINDMIIKVKITGQTLDKESVDAKQGFYNSSDNSITFDSSKINQFSMVNPSDEGDISFDFSTLVPSSKSTVSFGNSSIRFDISVTGDRVDTDGTFSPAVLFSDMKTLKVSSDLRLIARGYRNYGPFENSGAFPPKVDNETTYTIIWTASDSFNNVSGASVSAVLPPNVKWTGYTDPSTENITYDQGSGLVTWNIGDIRSGLGDTYDTRDVSFQVAVTPSISQVGMNLPLLNVSTISGIDAFSTARIGEQKDPITTNIVFDPDYVEDIGLVVK